MRQWDPETCPENFAMVLIGKRRSGKSTLLKSLCAHHWKNKFPSIYVFSQTAFNGFFEDFVPKRRFIWGEWKEDKKRKQAFAKARKDSKERYRNQ